MDTSSALRRLTNLPELLNDRGFEGPPAYRYIRDAAINRVIPAQQLDGIWYYQPADIVAIENALKQIRIRPRGRSVKSTMTGPSRSARLENSQAAA